MNIRGRVSCSSLKFLVIVVSTKYEQFLCNVEMHLLNYPNDYPDSSVSGAAARQFEEHYLHPLGDDI